MSLAAVFALILLAAPQTGDQPRILASFNASGTGTGESSADIIAVPDGVSALAYADQLIRQEGLPSWDEAGSVEGRAGLYTYRRVDAGDGRSVTISIVSEPRSEAPVVVCRIRASMTGLNVARGAAGRWCAQQFGIEPLNSVPYVVQGG